MNAERHQSQLDSPTRLRLYILERLMDDWVLAGKPDVLKYDWHTYDYWIREGGILGHDQLHKIFLGLAKDGLIKGHKWVNPAM